MSHATPPPSTRPVLIFDGECNLCNNAVDFLIRRDPEGRLRFAPNQGEFGRRILADRGKNVDDVGTLYLLERGDLYERSTAVLRALGYLNLPWRALGWLRLAPRPIRDAVYDFIARRRYRWFGRRATCRVPTADERRRFLD